MIRVDELACLSRGIVGIAKDIMVEGVSVGVTEDVA